MSSSRFLSLSSLRRQNLLIEFAGLRQTCPEGVYVTLTPGDPTLWSGVLFVRQGPYSPAILRFQISFPDSYPSLPPLVTFSTDIFHPLITPLTNYTYSTDVQDGGTVSATDDERLPPGGFSLRHGFPAWFGRATRSRLSQSPEQKQRQRHVTPTPTSTPPPARAAPATTPAPAPATPPRPVGRSRTNSTGLGSAPVTPESHRSQKSQKSPTSGSRDSAVFGTPAALAKPLYMMSSGELRDAGAEEVRTYDVLQYLRSAFDSEDVLDSIPLEAAGNPNAWHAWRAHQRQSGKQDGSGSNGNKGNKGDHGEAGPAQVLPTIEAASTAAARDPSQWNWEHVWEERVQKGIEASLSEPVLYGSVGAADDVIRFLKMDQNETEGVKENLKRTLGVYP